MEKSDRNLGIDLLRIVAMLLIVTLHVLGQGGILRHADILSKNYDVAWFMELLAYPSVAAFGMIAGYVGLNRSHRVSSGIYLWLQVFFYTVLITVTFLFVAPSVVNLTSVKYMFSPIMNEQYWYMSAYLGLFFFMDGLNFVINNMPKYKVYTMLIAAFMLFSVLPVLADPDTYSLKYGCSIICIACFYLYGACIKKYGIFSKVKSSVLWIVYLSCVLITWGSKIGIETVYGYSELYPDRGNILITYNSPTNVLAAAVLLVIFSRITLEGFLSKVVGAVAPLVLGVYLLNTHPLIFALFMKDIVADYANLPLGKMIGGVLLMVAFIFLLGIMIDAVRRLIFELSHLKEKLRAIENYIKERNSLC